jgi:hypothetical protein
MNFGDQGSGKRRFLARLFRGWRAPSVLALILQARSWRWRTGNRFARPGQLG